MALIGLGTVTLVALVLAVRSSSSLNKGLVLVMWSALFAHSAGFVA